MECDKAFSVKARNMSAVAALAVIVIHAGNGGMGSFAAKALHQFLGWGLCTFAVPWFFFASGYFFAGHLDEKDWWKLSLKTRLKTLVLPYIIWCGLFVCFSIAIDMFLNARAGNELFAGLTLRNLFLSGFGFDMSEHPMLVPFWYIRALLLIVLASPILVYALHRCGWWVPLAILPVYFYCCGMHDRYAMPWFLFYSPLSLAGWLYFSVGVLARLNKWECRKCRVPTWLCWLVALPGICIGRLALYKGLPIVANGLWIVTIPILLLGVWRLIPSQAMPSWLVASAFPVYAIHYFFEHALESLALPLHSPYVWAYISRIAIVAFFSLLVANVLRTFFPRTSDMLFGRR